MKYDSITNSITNMISLLTVYSGSSEVEWAYKDFRSDLWKFSKDALNEFEDGEFDPKDMLSDDIALLVGKAIMKQMYETLGEVKDILEED